MINIINNFKFLCVIIVFFGCILSSYGSDKPSLTAKSSSAPTPTTRTEAVSSPSSSTGDRPLMFSDLKPIFERYEKRISKMEDMIASLHYYVIRKLEMESNRLYRAKNPISGWIRPSEVTLENVGKQYDFRKKWLQDILLKREQDLQKTGLSKKIKQELEDHITEIKMCLIKLEHVPCGRESIADWWDILENMDNAISDTLVDPIKYSAE